MMEANLVDKARQIIAENRYLSLATCDGNIPWVAGLAYAVDKDYNFYFYSAKNSRHGQHIERNPQVAFTIFDSTLGSLDVDGLQIAGEVRKAKLTELPRVMKIYYEQLFPDEMIREQFRQPIEAFKGVAVKRFYKLTPIQVFKLDLSIIEVDLRVEIDLEDLRSQPAK